MAASPQTNIGEEQHALLHEMVDSLAQKLSRSIYSPRIKLLDINQVREVTGLSSSTIYDMVSKERFPRPMHGIGKNKWRESTIIAWMDAHDPDGHKDWSARKEGA